VGYFCSFPRLPKVNNQREGEDSPNLATLIGLGIFALETFLIVAVDPLDLGRVNVSFYNVTKLSGGHFGIQNSKMIQ
jgi:hypothetical protein